MKTSRNFLLGIVAAALLFGVSVVGCDKDDDGEDPVVSPVVINGYYGVTSYGETLEIIIKEVTAQSIAVASRMVIWGANNTYQIRVNGVVVSSGTATKTGESISFVPTDGSSVDVKSFSNDALAISVTPPDGIAPISATTIAAKDYYYAIGGPINKTREQLQADFAGKTPDKIYNDYFKLVDGYDYDAGTWAFICEFGKYYQCPNSELSRVANEMNAGNISGVGYYSHSSYGNIVYYVSKIPPGF